MAEQFGCIGFLAPEACLFIVKERKSKSSNMRVGETFIAGE
jgi:hypothetical protein